MNRLRALPWRSRTAVIDICAALLIAIVVLVVSPGLAVVALLALLVILIVAISFGVEAVLRRRRAPGRRIRGNGRKRSYHR